VKATVTALTTLTALAALTAAAGPTGDAGTPPGGPMPVFVRPGIVTVFILPAPIAYAATGLPGDRALRLEVLPAPHDNTAVLRIAPELYSAARTETLTNLVIAAGSSVYEFEIRKAQNGVVHTRVLVDTDPVETARRRGVEEGRAEAETACTATLTALADRTDRPWRIRIYPTPPRKAHDCRTLGRLTLCPD